MLGSARAEALSYSAVKLFSKNSNICEHGTGWGESGKVILQVSIAVFRALSKTFSDKDGSTPLEKMALQVHLCLGGQPGNLAASGCATGRAVPTADVVGLLSHTSVHILELLSQVTPRPGRVL